MKKHFFSIVFILFMVCIICMFAAACTNEEGGSDTSETVAGITNNGAADTTDSVTNTNGMGEEKPSVPENLDLEGFKFRLLYNKRYDEVDWSMDGIDGEAGSETQIDDAAFRRNDYLQEKYNFELVLTPRRYYELTDTSVRNILNAGLDEYDAIIMRQLNIAPIITNNLLLDFNELPGIDFEKPWWDKQIMEQLSISNKMFCGFGDLIVTTNRWMRVVFFNKKMVEQLGIETPYTYVENNTWTLDTLYSLSKDIFVDLNGNGQNDIEDRYGMTIQEGGLFFLYYSGGEFVTKKDRRDIPYFTVYSDRSIQLLTKLNELFKTPGLAIYDTAFRDVYPDSIYVGCQDVFEDNRALFLIEVLQLAERMRASEVDFGILPTPKFDENQDKYYSFCDSWSTNHILLPHTLSNVQETAYVLELMNYESMKRIRPAFYDLSLTYKHFRDEESAAMLDIIMNSRIVSLDEMFGWGMHNALYGTVTGRGGNFVSYIESVEGKIMANMSKTIDIIMDAY